MLDLSYTVDPRLICNHVAPAHSPSKSPSRILIRTPVMFLSSSDGRALTNEKAAPFDDLINVSRGASRGGSVGGEGKIFIYIYINIVEVPNEAGVQARNSRWNDDRSEDISKVSLRQYGGSSRNGAQLHRVSSRERRKVAEWAQIKASAEGSHKRINTEGAGESRPRGFAAGGPVMEVSASPASASTTTTTVIERSFAGSGDSEFPVWERLGAVVRLSYGIGIYGAMALAGKFICSTAGIDCTGGFHPSLEAVLDGLGYAAPPIMALLFILDDEVVKYSPHARAIRDVEDEELRSFFYGMSPWQFILIVAASSIGEELFYRVAVQGALADMFLRSTELMKDARGIASLTGVLPLFVPFAQAFAAVITAALTGSLYYVATAPKDPTYVIAPVLNSGTGREDLRKLFAAWFERRQMKKIYSPLLEGLLALYLGFEWIQTDNILAPMITHGIYSAVVLGHGLCKIHDHRRKLRQRIQQVRVETKNNNL